MITQWIRLWWRFRLRKERERMALMHRRIDALEKWIAAHEKRSDVMEKLLSIVHDQVADCIWWREEIRMEMLRMEAHRSSVTVGILENLCAPPKKSGGFFT
jgi:hypothetical protein